MVIICLRVNHKIATNLWTCTYEHTLSHSCTHTYTHTYTHTHTHIHTHTHTHTHANKLVMTNGLPLIWSHLLVLGTRSL